MCRQSMQDPLRPLHVGKYFPPFHGGMETFLGDLTCAQAARGEEPAVVAHVEGPATLGDHLCPTGQKVALQLAASHGRLLYTPISPTFGLRLAQAVRRFRPRLLHLHLPNPAAFWALALPATRRLPWVVHWHADVLQPGAGRALRLAYPFYHLAERRLLARARAVIATSPPYLEASPPLAPWRAKCRVIPLGMDPARLARPAAGAPSWPGEGGLKILAVGRLSYYKGFDHLLEALALEPTARLLLVGEGEGRAALEAQAGRLGLGRRVRFLGRVDDATLSALMRRCDCLCLPSIDRAEAFGMVLLEAMHAARPVVVADVPGSGMGWVVEEGITGLKVPPAQPAALAAALARLAAAPHRARQMGEQGRNRFDRLFHIQSVAERIAQLYREILDPPPCPTSSS